jgi:hypothetical protein
VCSDAHACFCILVHGSGIKLLPQLGRMTLIKRVLRVAGLPESLAQNHQDRFATALLKPGDCFA